MATELIVNATLPELRIALIENGQMQDLIIERASDKGIVGNIYKGRVTRVLPGMQAAFVDIGHEKAAFLYVDDVIVGQDDDEGQDREMDFPRQAGGSDEGDEPSEARAEIGEESETAPEVESEEDAGQESASSEEGFENETMDEPGNESDSETETETDSGSDIDSDEDPESMGDSPEEDKPELAAKTVKASAGKSVRPRGDHRAKRGRHGRSRRRDEGRGRKQFASSAKTTPEDHESDRANMEAAEQPVVSNEGVVTPIAESNQDYRSEYLNQLESVTGKSQQAPTGRNRPEFREKRGRDRRIGARTSMKPSRQQINIQDLLKEGQEVLVQVAKDAISTKGARLTCHISLPGRHLVCMPTIDHVGVSRRIERDDERRRLRDFVNQHRPPGVGFIVRTASGRHSEDRQLKQDIDYLTEVWNDISEKSKTLSAPALLYEDLNPLLRAIRDWVSDDIDRIMIDSKFFYSETLKFVSRFMPKLKSKIELYQGDIPIFDAYGVSTELSRGLERKVWLKSGGYLVIDQAEALVAIDVNTGRFVGKRNLEDTILKTNLEAAQEIAYQLRLRNCGGIIIIDFIDMERSENRQRLHRALEEAIRRDRARPTIVRFSDLGLVEMTRKRTRDTIVRTLCESCANCEGKGFHKSKTTVAYEILRELEREGNDKTSKKVLVQAHPDVIDLLAIELRDSLDQMERRYRKDIFLQAVKDFHQEQFELAADKDVKLREDVNYADEKEREHRRGGSQWRWKKPESSGHRRSRSNEASSDQGEERNSESPPAVVPYKIEIPKPRIIPVAPIVTEGNAGEAPVVVTPVVTIPAPVQVSDRPMDPMEEEDRLAFLRAQAAQDAAIASLALNADTGITRRGAGNGGGGRHPHRRNNGGGGGRGDSRRNNNRHHRGGGRHGGRGRDHWSSRSSGGANFNSSDSVGNVAPAPSAPIEPTSDE